MIDERLKENTSLVGESELSELRLMHDGEVEWLVIIPKRDVKEFIELPGPDRQRLWGEILEVSEILKTESSCDKLNVGALGNMVSQLHVHVIARMKTDRAWPGAIWGTKAQTEFNPSKIDLWKNKFSKSSFAI